MRRPERVTPAFCVRPAATWTTSVLSIGSRSGALSPPPHAYTDDSGGGMAGRGGPRGMPAGQRIRPIKLVAIAWRQGAPAVGPDLPLQRAPVVLLPVLPPGAMGGPGTRDFSALWVTGGASGHSPFLAPPHAGMEDLP